ncbi:flagellin N-terminal helical domain-containing protein [Paraburkholderia solisilvae]|uniref:Flagellin n=1 Tax=Paraburkholderia solisilvae TaxID=624376 RepID=A0A6J5EQX8_9BURK|nr:flagellin [Paraburkholderia solisilvae]CAB3768127.1 Flagellin [Paraburkholderia solisilvae]
MLSLLTNNPSLTAQQNLNASGNALNTAITRLSSGKRINSPSDDPAGLAITTSMQTQINGLNQGVKNANAAVSVVSTATTGLQVITNALQSIQTLAFEAVGGTESPQNQQALQKTVAQEIQEINQTAQGTSYNGITLLTGTNGILNIQIGATLGDTVSLDLSQGVSAASLGGGFVQAGNTLSTISGLNLNANGTEYTGAAGTHGAITSISINSNGTGGFTFTDQNGIALSSAATAALFSTTTTNGFGALSVNSSGALSTTTEINTISAAVAAGSGAAQGTVFGTISGISIDPNTGLNASANTPGAITSVTVEANGSGGLEYFDQNNQQIQASAVSGLFNVTSNASNVATAIGFAAAPTSTIGSTSTGAQPANSSLANVNTLNQPTSVADIDISTTTGANNAINVINNALAAISNLQASFGAAQTHFNDVAQSQQEESTDATTAQGQIADADFAAETANLSSAQVLQKAGISVLAQANSLQQNVLTLLQNL